MNENEFRHGPPQAQVHADKDLGQPVPAENQEEGSSSLGYKRAAQLADQAHERRVAQLADQFHADKDLAENREEESGSLVDPTVLKRMLHELDEELTLTRKLTIELYELLTEQPWRSEDEIMPTAQILNMMLIGGRPLLNGTRRAMLEAQEQAKVLEQQFKDSRARYQRMLKTFADLLTDLADDTTSPAG